MKKALVCGAGGFIGGHLVKALKAKGYFVVGADIKEHEFSSSQADEFAVVDLRNQGDCEKSVLVNGEPVDEVYMLAADMGGMGFIHSAECEIMRNSALININMIHAAATAGVGRYFFSSSVCVYRDMLPGEPELVEDDAVPANPDNEYGWEKLYAERAAQAYGRRYGLPIRIARFQNCYGPEGTWEGGREKAPAALCRKVAEAPNGGEFEVWGTGDAVRSYTYVTDMVQGILMLMESDLEGAVNIGSPEYVTVEDLAQAVVAASGKSVTPRYVPGPVGVQSRNFSHARIESLGWKAETTLRNGIGATYQWIEKQVESTRAGLR